MPKTLILDSSQIACWMECPQQWSFRYDQRLGRSAEAREDFAMGHFGHKLLEIYYEALRRGATQSEAIRAADTFDFDAASCECKHPREQHLIFGQPTICHQDTCPCEAFNPVRFPLSDEKRSLVRQAFERYWMSYSRNDVAPQIVEKGFSYSLLDDGEFLFVLEGRIDLIGLLGGQQVFLDHKFQGRAHELYTKAIQFRNYSLATNLSLGIVNYIRLHKELGKDTLIRRPINFSALERDLWKARLIEIYKRILNSIEWGAEKNESACAGRFGIPCEFTKICEESNPQIAIAIRDNYFVKKEEWRPW